MKIKKEVWVEQCDFCESKKTFVCKICGKDVCNKHVLNLNATYVNESSSSGIYLFGDTVKDCFCPNHLGEEMKKLYEEYLKKKEIEK